jgi:hypothetical protein
MTLRILALILSLISMTVALSSPSDAYQVGYAEGRFDLYTESKAIKKFNQCVAEKRKHQKPAGRIRSNGQRFFIGVGMQ